MFAAQLLLGGNPLVGAAGGAAALAAAGGFLYAIRKKIPHPTEFAPIGFCFLRGGCHEHEAIDIVIETHEAENIPGGSGTVYFYAEAGRFDGRTSSFPIDPKSGSVELFERVNLHVRQKDKNVTVSLWKENAAFGSKLVGELDLNVKKDIVEAGFPQMHWYNLKREGKTTTIKIRLSIHHLKGGAGIHSSLVEYALLRAERDPNAKGVPSFELLDAEGQIRFLSRVLEGPLKILRNATWYDCYFKPVELSKFRWSWRYWRTKEDADRPNCKALGSVPLLAVATVLADRNNRQQFYVKYYTRAGVEELYLRRVDRDRDLWSEGLYEFLERLRTHLEEIEVDQAKSKGDAVAASAKPAAAAGSSSGAKAAAGATAGAAAVAPAAAPAAPGFSLKRGQKPAGKTPSPPPAPTAKVPTNVKAMVAEAMAGYVDDDDDFDSGINDEEEALLKKTADGGKSAAGQYNARATANATPDEDAESAIAPVAPMDFSDDEFEALPIDQLEKLLKQGSRGAPL